MLHTSKESFMNLNYMNDSGLNKMCDIFKGSSKFIDRTFCLQDLFYYNSQCLVFPVIIQFIFMNLIVVFEVGTHAGYYKKQLQSDFTENKTNRSILIYCKNSCKLQNSSKILNILSFVLELNSHIKDELDFSGLVFKVEVPQLLQCVFIPHLICLLFFFLFILRFLQEWSHTGFTGE